MPSSVNDPLVLLTNKDERQPRFLTNIYNPAACAGLGFGIALIMNWGLRKPIFSGIQTHLAFMTLGGFLGTYIDKKRNDALATRDAIFRHYVELHPEDFPAVERKKYGDILESWVPIR